MLKRGLHLFFLFDLVYICTNNKMIFMIYYYEVHKDRLIWSAILYENCQISSERRYVIDRVDANSHSELMTKISEFVDKMKNNSIP